MASFKLNSIDQTTGIVSVDVTTKAGTKTFVLSGMPLDSKDSFVAALKDYIQAWIAGKQAEKAAVATPGADLTAIVASSQTLDVTEP